MTIEIMDGFDLYGNLAGLQGEWGSNGTPGFSTFGGRFNGGAVQISASSTTIYKVDVLNVVYVTIGFAVKSDLASDARIFMWSDAVGSVNDIDANVAFNIRTDGSILLEGDSGGNVGTSDTGVIVADTWYYIELQVHRLTAGSGEVFVNGTSVLSVPSADFSESTVAGSFNFGLIESTGVSISIDDIYIAQDASSLPAIFGDVRIETLLPDGDTAQADWTPLSGSGFSNIDDALGTNGDGDTSYINETTLNNKSEFDCGNLSTSPTAIHAIAISSRASKTDAGTIEYTQYIDSGGTESLGTPEAPAESTYNKLTDIFETDPNTAVAWTEAGVNAVKLGYEITG